MNINKSNYEAYAIDYLEGNLPQVEKVSFDSFLKEHPVIAKEMEMMAPMSVDKTIYTYPQKEKLLKKKKYVGLYFLFVLIALVSAYFMLGNLEKEPVIDKKTNQYLAQKEVPKKTNDEIKTSKQQSTSVIEHNKAIKTSNLVVQTKNKKSNDQRIAPKKTNQSTNKKPAFEQNNTASQTSYAPNPIAASLPIERSAKTEKTIPQKLNTKNVDGVNVTSSTQQKTIVESSVPILETKTLTEEDPFRSEQVTLAAVVTPTVELTNDIISEPKNEKKKRKIRFQLPAKLAGITDAKRNSVIPRAFRGKK